ncbi:hypothetical protein DUI87_07619 [Hirundo rustica rustica]|uniref:Uncharacterized protein n=1 Tax=Hirundo rustica rustica TaxID=333673 RepID=A0A3M0KQB4_HIRRU|nr:hypothetical protein DUI87_07619 [Hirundo rustica rustica]
MHKRGKKEKKKEKEGKKKKEKKKKERKKERKKKERKKKERKKGIVLLGANSTVHELALPRTRSRGVQEEHVGQITVEKLPNLSHPAMLLNRYTTDPWYQQLFINLYASRVIVIPELSLTYLENVKFFLKE